MSEEMKTCPYCGEEILAVAKKCKHCGEWLEKKTTTVSSKKQVQDLNIDEKWKQRFDLIEKYYIEGVLWKANEDGKQLAPAEFNKVFQRIVFDIGSFISVVLFGVFYYLFRGMWLKFLVYALILTILSLVTVGMGTIPFCVVLGILAPFDYYRLKVLGKQW